MKLDQIPKKNPFNAPEGYFDTLPGIVQSRIEAERPARPAQVYFRFTFRYALPVLLLVVAGIFWFKSYDADPMKFETALASIDATDLELYLEGTDINADEWIETADWSAEDLQELENTIYAGYDLPVTDVDGLLNIYEVEPVTDSVQ